VHIEEKDLIVMEINVYILGWKYTAGKAEPRKYFLDYHLALRP
jgi:hypothetical protein